jgi:SAM-dependent methyltransferase
MAAIEQDVASHYTHGSLEQSILAGLAGVQVGDDTIARLAAVDEFHIGGREATAEVADQLALQPGLRVLDVGCGMGGTARFLASHYGCRVTGVDLTPEFVDVGNSLNRRVGLSEAIDLHVASALYLPFDNGSFDRATLFHVGMNIADKRKLFAEIARILKPAAFLAVYDVMRMGDGELTYPVPWAQTAATSFVERPETYRSALCAVDFELAAERNTREPALVFFRRMTARVADSGAPPLGLHILMGREASIKVANMIENLECDLIAPVEMIARRL